jgi:isoquinoline 1-oxidoreductase beta subunit
MARLTAGLDDDGVPVAWRIRLAGPSILATVVPEMLRVGIDRNFMQGFLEDMPYHVPNYLVDYAMRNTPVPLGVQRGVNHAFNAFFKECFVDEMAHATGQDPYLFRRRLLAGHPRHLAVLDAAAIKAGWGSPLPAGRHRGIALNETCGSYCAQVVEASISPDGSARVHRVVSAIDPGYVVNPLTVKLQTQGAVAFALSAALYGEISIRDGRVQQNNFHDYEMLRLPEMPRVDTVILASGGFWGGVGEPPLPPVAPALCNAIFAATGQRIRSLPLNAHHFRRSLGTMSDAAH